MDFNAKMTSIFSSRFTCNDPLSCSLCRLGVSRFSFRRKLEKMADRSLLVWMLLKGEDDD